MEGKMYRFLIESKDEKNVRRRVYDALNVLIAAGVINKRNKVRN
jgi:E2F/DP family winged-helix DNA-binding domain